MGKRKAKRKPGVPAGKRKQKLDSCFNCPFCNSEYSVDCKLDRGNSIGFLNCGTCGEHYEVPINALSEAVDVYSDWIDACEEVNKVV